MNKTYTSTIFYTLVVVFVFLVCQFFVPVVTEFVRGPIFLLPIAVFFLLGVVLIFSTIKEKVKGRLKTYLILTGASSAGFFVSILLHNFFYALEIISSNIIILKYLMEILHVGFFLIGVIVCPILFLIGMIGSMVLFVKKKSQEQSS